MGVPGSKGCLPSTQRAPGPPVPAPPVSEPGSQRLPVQKGRLPDRR